MSWWQKLSTFHVTYVRKMDGDGLEIRIRNKKLGIRKHHGMDGLEIFCEDKLNRFIRPERNDSWKDGLERFMEERVGKVCGEQDLKMR